MPANHCMPHTEQAKAKMSAARLGIANLIKRREHFIRDGIEVWRCGHCFEFFPKEGFYKNKRTVLGITSECKKCHSEVAMRTRNPDLTRVTNREYAKRVRLNNPEKVKEWEKRGVLRRVKDDKYQARVLLNRAVRSGKMEKPLVCTHCNQFKRLTGHHHDYSLPLDVIWLCYQCHADLERGLWVVSFRKIEPGQKAG